MTPGRRRRAATRVLAALLLAALAACVPEGFVSHESRAVDIRGWRRQDTVMFSVDTLRVGGDYAFSIGLRATRDYPYTEAALVVVRRFGPEGASRRDTVRFPVVSEDTRRMSPGIHLHSYAASLPPMSLPAGATGRVDVVQAMPRESLPGIYDIGLRLCRLSSDSPAGVATRVDAQEDEQKDGEAPE